MAKIIKKVTKKTAVKVYKAPSIEEFKAMTPAQKRITIAKDVIAAVNAEIYIANTGRYISEFEIGDEKRIYNSWSDWNRSDDIQQVLPNIKNCEVCAMGACILSITKYENKLKFSDIGRVTSDVSVIADEVVSSVFPAETLAMIEIMFEGQWEYEIDNYGRNRLKAKVSKEDAATCIEFYKIYKADDNERMKAIMEHIVANNGEVVPAKMN